MKDEMEKKNVEDVEQVETNTDESRRTFLKGTASAIAAGSVLGASVLSGVGMASAQDAKPGHFATPDWRTLKPGAKDSAMYTEETGFDENDPDMTWWSGRNIAGVTIGLVQIRANLPMMPGNMGNASTFDFPMVYREMNVDNAMDVMKPERTKNFEDGIVEAAKWLELQGVSAIVANCGFFAHYQKVVQARIDTPFFSSSLMMMPMLVQSMPRNKKVGVLTANGPLLKSGVAMENCGLSRELQASRVVIEGCEHDPEFASVMMGNGTMDAAKFERDILKGIKRLLKKDKDIAAIMLECTELPPHAVAVQKLVKMPVWDYTSMVNFIQSGCVRRPFVGHI
jgi:aspartate/glutamate racemase